MKPWVHFVALLNRAAVHQKLENELTQKIEVFSSDWARFLFASILGRDDFGEVVAWWKKWRTEFEPAVLEVESPGVKEDSDWEGRTKRREMASTVLVV